MQWLHAGSRQERPPRSVDSSARLRGEPTRRLCAFEPVPRQSWPAMPPNCQGSQTVAQGGSRTALLLRRANCDWDDRLEGEPGRVTGRDETVVEWGEPGRVEVN
jgi:hypothetical protein